MRKPFVLILSLFVCMAVDAAAISGTIKEKNGTPLPFSSILVKGTTQGVSANSKGSYTVQLEPGEYTLVCQYIGHKSVEKKIRVGKADQVIDFELEEQQYSLKEVEVKSGGEDPAYAIIRKAIQKREEHLKEIKKFQCEVYIKGQMQLRSFPKTFFGKKVDFEDGDTSKRRMIFLSETVAKYSVQLPEKEKVEVISTKVSGRSGAFGLSDPQIISFYENNISVGEDLNPRGFISPIANGALNFYRYKFEGTFYESGKEVSRIKVIPRRAYEPLFSGYINIIEDEWRIQSVDLVLVRAQQMQLLDTLRIQQLYVPSGNAWVIKNQVIYPSGKILGFDFFGSFVQVYDKFDMDPKFKPKFFDHTILKFYDSSNKKPASYWDSIRPLPLLAEEMRDYKKKDSLEQVRKDPRYLDSLDAKRNKVRLSGILFAGQSFTVRKRKENIRFESLLSTLNYNTVEGGVVNFSPNYSRRFEGRKFLFINPDLRYGFANHHLNPSLNMGYNFGKKYFQNINISGGRNVFQFNNAGAITQRLNTLSTLFSEANYLKIYQADFLRVGYSAGIGNGLSISGNFQFQDRSPLENLADPVTWKKNHTKSFTPNYPTEITTANMIRNQASMLTVGLIWRPGADYIEFPDRKVGLGSKYPTFTASVTKGINGMFGSDVDYTKWRVGMNDDIDLKLAGKLSYNIVASGFFDAAKTFIPDYLHYLGNQTIFASRELSSFQLAPYYKYSNTAKFNLAAHAEYHLNGLLSNKIPGFKKLNWFFVTGANALHIDKNADYYELLFGIENILKVIRVDFVQGFESGGGRPSGFRVSLPLF
ncbi:MAG: DUF5686 and carboxypeptidase regulatory-like domain-containing protein [Bacteroidota bacterium]